MIGPRRPHRPITNTGTLPHRRLGTVLAALMAGLLVAGCGSGGASKSTTAAAAAAITKSEFLARANAVCGSADPVLSEGLAKLASHPSKAQVVAIVEGTFVPSIETQIAGIRALGVPSGERAIVKRMLTLVEDDLGRLKQNPALIATDLFGNYARVSHPYGLTACAPTS